MHEVLENIKDEFMKEHNFDFQLNSELYYWTETNLNLKYQVLSTSSLIEYVHKCGFEIIKPYLTEKMVCVVSKTNFEHISITPQGFKVYVKLKVSKIIGNTILFEGEAFDEINKIAQFSFERKVISKKTLERKSLEKLNKLN